LVVWGSVSELDFDCQLFINKPSGSYGTSEAAINDASKFTNFTIPSEYRGVGFLIARIVLRYQTSDGGTFTVEETEDLRGLFPSTGAGAGTISSTSVFYDNAIQIKNVTDITKVITFDASAITPGNSRGITMADRDIDLVNVPDAFQNGVILTANNAQISRNITTGTDFGITNGSFVEWVKTSNANSSYLRSDDESSANGSSYVQAYSHETVLSPAVSLVTQFNVTDYAYRLIVDKNNLNFDYDLNTEIFYADTNGIRYGSDLSSKWSTDRYIPDIGYLNDNYLPKTINTVEIVETSTNDTLLKFLESDIVPQLGIISAPTTSSREPFYIGNPLSATSSMFGFNPNVSATGGLFLSYCIHPTTGELTFFNNNFDNIGLYKVLTNDDQLSVLIDDEYINLKYNSDYSGNKGEITIDSTKVELGFDNINNILITEDSVKIKMNDTTFIKISSDEIEVMADTFKLINIQNKGSDKQLFYNSSTGEVTYSDTSSGISLGTDAQIPYMNLGGTDFDYSTDFTYNDDTLKLWDTYLMPNSNGIDWKWSASGGEPGIRIMGTSGLGDSAYFRAIGYGVSMQAYNSTANESGNLTVDPQKIRAIVYTSTVTEEYELLLSDTSLYFMYDSAGTSADRYHLNINKEGFYLPELADGSDSTWLGLTPDGKVFSDSLADASFALTMPLKTLSEYLNDKLDGEIRWFYEKHGIICSEYSIKGGPGKTIQKLQAGQEVALRYIRDNQIRIEQLERENRDLKELIKHKDADIKSINRRLINLELIINKLVR